MPLPLRASSRGRVLAPVVLGTVALVLAGCSGSGGGTGAPSPSETPLTSPSTPATTPTAATTFEVAPGCRAPAWSGTTVFGTSLGLSTRFSSFPEAVADADARFGRTEAVRVFDPGVPPPGVWSRRTPYLDGRTVVTSFRMPPAEVLAGDYDDQLLDFFRQAPDSPVFWSYYHEPEAGVVAGEYTAPDFVAAFQHVADIAGSLCRPNLYPTVILTGFTVDPASGRDWHDYYPGDDYVSVLAWDPYNSASSTPTSYVPPADLFGSVVEASREAGKPLGIAETGSQLVPGDDGTGRARWLERTARYFTREDAAFVTYYDSVGTRGADYRLTDRPSMRAWKGVIDK